MKKIAFSDRYGLTQAVIEGRKTMTRRIIPDIEIDWNRRGCIKVPISGFEHGVLLMDLSSILFGESFYLAPKKYQPRFEVGEVVAVSQRYKDINLTFIPHQNAPGFKQLSRHCRHWGNAKAMAGWTNKMFVCADLMPHRISITDIKLERIQDISDEDCMREGIMEGEFMNTWDTFYFDQWGDVPNHITFKTPRAAFADLIDRISGKGTWERNPWDYAYSFELVKEEEQ